MKYTVEVLEKHFIINYITFEKIILEAEYWYKYRTEILHREDNLPALLKPDYLCYYKNDHLHRTDGPAEIFPANPDCNNYYLNGEFIPVFSDEEFFQYQKLMAFQ